MFSTFTLIGHLYKKLGWGGGGGGVGAKKTATVA